MENGHRPESTDAPKWMTKEDKSLIKGIEETLISEDYFGEGLDHIQGLYYGATTDRDRELVILEASDFIAKNKHSDKPGVMERVEAYKAFLVKIKGGDLN